MRFLDFNIEREVQGFEVLVMDCGGSWTVKGDGLRRSVDCEDGGSCAEDGGLRAVDLDCGG
jgi:hypothetical protein